MRPRAPPCAPAESYPIEASMAIHVAEHHGFCIVQIDSYNLDAAHAAPFTAAVTNQLKAGTRVIIDAEKVQFADSRGRAALASLARLTKPGAIVLCGVNRRFARFLAMLPADRKLPTRDSVADAMRLFAPRRSSDGDQPQVLSLPKRPPQQQNSLLG